MNAVINFNSGGIRLRFSGQYLDVVQQPAFLVTDGRYNSTLQVYIILPSCNVLFIPWVQLLPLQDCSVINEQLIECITPHLDGPTTSSLRYTVVVDGAPGPDSSDESLRLAVVPNPTFGENGTALVPEDSKYPENSAGRFIRIRVKLLPHC